MPAGDGRLLDINHVREIADGCGWTLGEFAAFYAAGARKEIDDLSQALEDGDRVALARLAHGAAGSSESAGMIGLTPHHRDIERAAPTELPETLSGRIATAGDCLELVLAALERLAEDPA